MTAHLISLFAKTHVFRLIFVKGLIFVFSCIHLIYLYTDLCTFVPCPDESFESPGAEVIRDYELPDMGAGK